MSETESEEEKSPETTAASSDAEDGHEVPVRRQRPPHGDEPVSVKKGLFIVIPLVMVAAAVVGLVFTGMEDNGIYEKPVGQVLKEKDKWKGRPVRASGMLVHGTLVKKDSPCEYRFTLEDAKQEMPVSYKQCVVPDTFRDVPDMDVSVTVEGQLHADNSFEATKVVAKCPSKYEMQERARNGEKMPHASNQQPM